MLKTVLLVTITWTALSFLFCVAWSRLLHRRALISSTPVSVRGTVTFGPAHQGPPRPGRGSHPGP